MSGNLVLNPMNFQACRLLIEAVATAPTPHHRVSVLKLALLTFDHLELSSIDQLVPGLPVLVHCLERSARHQAWQEVGSLSRLIAIVLRGSEERVVPWAQSVIASLFGVLLCSLNQMIAFEQFDGEHVRVFDAIYVLLEHISTVKISLRSTKNAPQLLLFLQHVIRNGAQRYSLPVQTEVMRLLAGWSQHRDNIVIILQRTALLDIVLKSGTCLGSELHIATFLRRLLREPQSQFQLNHRRSKRLMSKLLHFFQLNHGPTRIEAFRIVHIVAATPTGKVALVRCKTIVQHLVSDLMRQDMRSLALETLMRLIAPRTARRLTFIPGLVLGVVGGDDAMPLAAHALKRLAMYLGAWNRMYPDVIDALVKLSASSNPDVRVWAARSFLEQSRPAASGFFLVRTPDVMANILELCHDKVSVIQAIATETVLCLASTTANRKRLLTHVKVLPTMVHHALALENQCEWRAKANRFAVKLILSLIDIDTVRMRVAKELNLLLSLSKYAVSMDEDKELRHAALHGVMVLAPLL